MSRIFFGNFDLKNGCKNEFEDNNENPAVDSKIGFPLKIDIRADWFHESIPTAWELRVINSKRMWKKASKYLFFE